MSDTPQGDGWWQASDQRWYPPESHPDNQPAVASEPARAAGARGWRQRALVLIPIILVVGVGGFFLLRSADDGAEGGGTGAASAEAAVQQLIASIDDEDVLGAIAIVDPEELEAGRALVEGIQRLAGRSSVVDLGDGALPAGIDISVGGADFGPLVLETEAIDDETAIVVIDELSIRIERPDGPGQAIVLYDDDELPEAPRRGATPERVYRGDALDAYSTLDLGSDEAIVIELQNRGSETALEASVGEQRTEADVEAPLQLVVVKRRGSWYVSAAFTVVEALRRTADLDRVEYGDWRRALDSASSGAPDPESAVESLFAGVADYEPRDVLDVIDPEAGRFFHDAYPAFERDIDDELVEARNRSSLDFGRIDLVREDSDGETRVWVESTDGTFFGDGDQFTFDTRDWCLTVRDQYGDSDRECIDGILDDIGLFGYGNLGVDLGRVLPESPFFVTVERDGNWFVSPLGTASAWISDVIDRIEQEEEVLAGDEVDAVLLEAVPVRGGSTVDLSLDTGPQAVAVSLDADLDMPVAGWDDGVGVALVKVEAAGPVRVALGDGGRGEAWAGESFTWIVSTSTLVERAFGVVVTPLDGPTTATVTVSRPAINLVEQPGLYNIDLGDDGTAVVFVDLSDVDRQDPYALIDGREAPSVRVYRDDLNWELVNREDHYSRVYRTFVVVEGVPGGQQQLEITP